MKAIVAHGAKRVEFVQSHPKPNPGPDEVLIRVAASPIQPSDFLNISGGFPNTEFPIIPGRDYSGTVVEPESSIWHGRTVYGTSGPDLSITRNGTHAEYVVVPETALASTPKNLSLLQASLVGTPWTTAYMLLSRTQAKQGETVLVTGAGGNVGSAVVQLAKSSLFACNVLSAGRGEKYDVDVTKDPEMKSVGEAIQGAGVDVAIDTTGDLSLAYAGLKVLNKRGRLGIISTGSSHGGTNSTVPVDFKTLYRLEHAIVGCNSFNHSMEECADWLTKIAGGFEAGELTPSVSDGPRINKIRLDEVDNAYAEIAKGSRQLFLISIG